MDYFDEDRLYSVNEFYESAEKQRKELKKSGVISEEEIENKRALLLGAQFVSKKYIEQMEENPDEYPEINPTDIMGEITYIDAVREYMMQNGDGEQILDDYPIISAAIMVKDAHAAIDKAGIKDSIVERIVHSVVPTIEAVTAKAINHAPEFNITATNLINAPKILSRYPEMIKLMTDEATRTVFTNQAERNQWTQYTVTQDNKRDTASLLLSQSITADPKNKVLIEQEFSIYDWAVMEAIATLYWNAERTGALTNGAVCIDIQSIDKILKRDISSRMSSEAKKKILSSDIVISSVKLLGNHIQIMDPSGNYEGDLIEGELRFAKNKLSLLVKSKPILLDYAEKIKHFEPVKLDKLGIKLSAIDAAWTKESIAIYRFLLERIREIFGSCEIDKKHVQPKAGYTNSITFQSIIDAVYPNGLGAFKDEVSKRRYILQNVENICEAMKKSKKVITDYQKGYNKQGEVTFSFSR